MVRKMIENIVTLSMSGKRNACTELQSSRSAHPHAGKIKMRVNSLQLETSKMIGDQEQPEDGEETNG